MSKKHWFWLAAVLVFGVSLFGGDHVPLYNGVGFPDEPYRYVAPPSQSLATKKPPTIATLSMTVANGTNNGNDGFRTGESGPQFLGYALANSFKTAGDAKNLTLHAQPLAPNGSQSPIGPILGNIYRLSATSDSTTTNGVSFNNSVTNSVYIELRLPQGYDPPAAIVYRPSPAASWTSLRTSKIGTDIYLAHATGFGDFGIVKTASTSSPTPSKPAPSQTTTPPSTVTPTISATPKTTANSADNADQKSDTNLVVLFAGIISATILIIAVVLAVMRVKQKQRQSNHDETPPSSHQ